MRFDLAWITLGNCSRCNESFQTTLGMKTVCILCGGEPKHGAKHRYEDNRKVMRGERRKEKEERDRWCNRWYILPGGSQGRGEGGSAIRQHTQEGGGQNISSVSKLGQRENKRGEKRNKSVQLTIFYSFFFLSIHAFSPTLIYIEIQFARLY